MKQIIIKTCQDCPYVKGAGVTENPFLCKHQMVRFKRLDIIQRWCQLPDANSVEPGHAADAQVCALCSIPPDDTDNCNFCPDCGRDLRAAD